MRQRARTPCAVGGCNELTRLGRCDKHRRKAWRKRADNPTTGMYGNDWRKARAAFLIDHPLCVECEGLGRTTLAKVVDHITPHRGDQALFWDMGNWQALCEPCHNAKTRRGE